MKKQLLLLVTHRYVKALLWQKDQNADEKKKKVASDLQEESI